MEVVRIYRQKSAIYPISFNGVLFLEQIAPVTVAMVIKRIYPTATEIAVTHLLTYLWFIISMLTSRHCFTISV